MIRAARQGQMVVRLKGGDPFVFGRGGEEAMALAKEKIPFEIVPGVTSGIAVPAREGIPVTHRGLSTELSLQIGARAQGAVSGKTLVGYMSVDGLGDFLDKAKQNGFSRKTPAALTTLNQRSRLPLKLEESHRPGDTPLRVSSTLLRKLRRSLIFVADGTTILSLGSHPPQLFPSSKVCVELGYALHCKRSEQLLVAQMERKEVPGQFPFDLTLEQKLVFETQADLHKLLLPALENKLKQFNLV